MGATAVGYGLCPNPPYGALTTDGVGWNARKHIPPNLPARPSPHHQPGEPKRLHHGFRALLEPVGWICSPIASIEAPPSIRWRMSLRRMSCWTIWGIRSSFSIRRQT